jgi:competence ComEA-like helix-hairpin-helix protein
MNAPKESRPEPEFPIGERWLRPEQQRGLCWILAGLFLVLASSLIRDRWMRDRVEFDQLPSRPIDFRLDLNQANKFELVQLPGVGTKLAETIVEYRRANGDFRSIDDLREVSGVGPATLDGLRPYLTVRPSAMGR